MQDVVRASGVRGSAGETMTFVLGKWKDRFEREYIMVGGDEVREPDTKVPLNLILLTYNCDDYIEKCLKATENQVDGVYALDNGSKDNTLSILKDFNVDVIKSGIKGDLSKIMNKNLKRVPKGWCFYVNPDEILFERNDGYLKKYCSFLERNNIRASDVRFPDFIYNYRTLFAGFDWGEGPTGVYWTARRLFKYTGNEIFTGKTHYNISNTNDPNAGNYEHHGSWDGVVAKTNLINLFHYGKCRGIERQRGKGERLVDGEMIASGMVPTMPYFGHHPKVMGVR